MSTTDRLTLIGVALAAVVATVAVGNGNVSARVGVGARVKFAGICPRVDHKMLWLPVASSDRQGTRVLAVVKAPRYARPPLRGADGLLTTAPRTPSRTGSYLSMPNRAPQDVGVDDLFWIPSLLDERDTTVPTPRFFPGPTGPETNLRRLSRQDTDPTFRPARPLIKSALGSAMNQPGGIILPVLSEESTS